MNDLPVITIITSTLNSEKYLEKSIDSVINQTYRNFEYIIIDGGSTDGTIEIIKKYSKHISFWISEKDDGIYEAWNKGIKKSKGSWILFIGSDDILLPDAINLYIEYIIQNTKSTFDYISSQVQRIKPDGKIESIVGKQWKWNEFKYRMTTAHPGSLHSKKFFDEYGLYNTDYKIVSDYEILLRPKEKLKAGYIPKITVHMSTGGKFNRTTATKEVIYMFNKTRHLNTVSRLIHSANLLIKLTLKKIIKSV